MTYAIIETGGKQLRVEPGRFYDVERLAVEAEGSVSIDRVLYVDNDGEIHVGQPWVDGAIVEATVLSHLRGRKIIVYKMRPKKKTRKKQGHRQELTRLLINAISIDGTVVSGEQLSASVPVAETTASQDSVAEEETPVAVAEEQEEQEEPVVETADTEK